LYAYNKQHTRVELGRLTIYGLCGYGLDPVQLEPFFDALTQLGVPYASQSTMCRTLLLRCLERPLSVAEIPGDAGYVGRRLQLIGRREAIPNAYHGVVQQDIPAAFPTAMLEALPMGLAPGSVWWHEHGAAEAIVSGGREAWSLLAPGQKSAHGIWSFEELRAAEDVGCDIRIIQAWEGSDVQQPFRRWHETVLRLRELPGQSGTLAKTITNRTWSMFCMRRKARYTRTTFEADGTPFIRVLKSGSSPECAFLGGLIAGRVRARLLLEGLRRGAAFCETDSVITPLGDIPGWRRKAEISVLEIPSAEAYRYKCMRGLRDHLAIDGCVDCADDRWHYVAQGRVAGSADAELEFKRQSDARAMRTVRADH